AMTPPLIAPDLKHEFPAEWQKKAEALYAKLAKERPEFPNRVRFVTYTMRYPSCQWVEILGLERHYTEARVDAERTENGYAITTANVRTLHLTLPELPSQLVVKIDDQVLTPRPWLNQGGTYHVYLTRRPAGGEREGGRWTSVLPQRLLTERTQKPQKMT